jgi:putative transposase
VILDRDKKFGLEVISAIRAMGSKPKRTSFQSPWQNGVADCCVERCRWDLLDHVIVINERHLKRLLSEYVSYHHEDRTHLGLSKETPGGGVPSESRSRVIAQARLGGLHRRYDRTA